ncbi:hypothetical protein, partial [Iamia sp.]|uniref:hypothetical protein n=1 Tax=Iamia sp. TaxID=2722710 RepID=UPI002BA33E09
MSDAIAQLREMLRPKVGGPDDLFRVAWAAFRGGDYAEEVIGGELSEADAVAKLRSWVNASRTISDDPGEADRGGGDFASHQAALAVVTASRASGDDAVIAWRAAHLPQMLTSSDELRAWVVARMRSVEADSPEAFGEQLGTTVRWVNFEGLREFRYTTGAPVLVELAQVARRLWRYGWREAEATTFVLTGAVPMVPMIRTKIGGRIALQVHPATPPAEVARAYAEARVTVLPGRARLISARVAAAVLVAHTTPGTWEARNRELRRRGEPGYATGDDMRRTVERAEAKLMGERPGHRPIDQV